jgi:hypothetical protein
MNVVGIVVISLLCFSFFNLMLGIAIADTTGDDSGVGKDVILFGIMLLIGIGVVIGTIL